MESCLTLGLKGLQGGDLRRAPVLPLIGESLLLGLAVPWPFGARPLRRKDRTQPLRRSGLARTASPGLLCKNDNSAGGSC